VRESTHMILQPGVSVLPRGHRGLGPRPKGGRLAPLQIKGMTIGGMRRLIPERVHRGRQEEEAQHMLLVLLSAFQSMKESIQLLLFTCRSAVSRTIQWTIGRLLLNAATLYTQMATIIRPRLLHLPTRMATIRRPEE
jgi:hypothetical protein